jgi:hypothetical protein
MPHAGPPELLTSPSGKRHRAAREEVLTTEASSDHRRILNPLVVEIISRMPSRISAETHLWHESFKQIRDRYGDELPALRQLEYHTRPDRPPISQRLESILQSLSLSEKSVTHNARLVTRDYQATKHKRLTKAAMRKMELNDRAIQKAAVDLARLLKKGTKTS